MNGTAHHIGFRELTDRLARGEISKSNRVWHSVVSLEPRIPLELLLSQIANLRQVLPFRVGDGLESSFEISESAT